MARFHIRLYEPGDEEKIVNLLSLIFNGWPHFDLQLGMIEHWKWKFLDVPSGLQIAGLAFAEDQLIGCNHNNYFQIKIVKNMYLGQQAVDFGVHPEYRRMGVSKLIGEVMEKRKKELDPAVTYVNTSNEIIMNNYKKDGIPAFPRVIRNLIRIQNIDKHFESSERKNKDLIKLGLKVVNLATKIQIRLTKGLETIEVNEIKEFKSNVEEFWGEIKDEYYWIVARTHEYLNWRYCDPRGGKYRVTSVEETGKLVGYCVSRINNFNPEYPKGIIVDILSLPNRKDVTEILLVDALNYFDSQGINCVHAWAGQKHSFMKMLNKYGFIDTRENVNFFYVIDRELDSYNGDLEYFQNAKEEKIHLMYGDTDWI